MTQTWTVETDDEVAARQRTGAINGRYLVCHPVDGFIESVDRIADAFAIADRWDERDHGYAKFEVEVYDRMARKGHPTVWRRQRKDGDHCFEHGDRLTMNGRFKVVKRRGIKPVCDDLSQKTWKLP